MLRRLLPRPTRTIDLTRQASTATWPCGTSVDAVLAWFDAQVATQPDLAVRELLLQVTPRRRWWLSLQVGRWVRLPSQYVEPGVAYEALRPALATQLRLALPHVAVETLALDLSAANVAVRIYRESLAGA